MRQPAGFSLQAAIRLSQSAIRNPKSAIPMPDWSIIIPSYNEEQRIGATLRAIEDFIAFRGINAEIVVVDDGSTDNMVALIGREFPRVRILRNPGNRGKGYSVRTGMQSAAGKWVLFSDADLSTPIEELLQFECEFANGADIVIGSRALRDSKILVHQAWWREMSGRIFNFLVRTISGLPFHDTQCGFKAYRQEAARRIAALQRLEGWAFDVEQLYLARRLAMDIREVPVRWVNSPATRVKFLRDSTRMLLDVIRIRLTRYPV